MWPAIYIVKKSQFQFKPNWIENTNYNTNWNGMPKQKSTMEIECTHWEPN